MIPVQTDAAALERVATQVKPLKELRPAEMLAHLESWIYHPTDQYERFRQLLWQMALLQDHCGDFWTNEQYGVVQRALGKADFFYFAVNILNFRKPFYKNDLQIGLHDQVCRLIEDESQRNVLVLLPRNCQKTNIVTIAGALWQTARYPEKRIAIVSSTRVLAVGILAAIKQHIKGNQLFQGLYPDRLPAKDAVWNEDSILLPRQNVYRENTIEVVAPEVEYTGKHYDYFVADDLVTDKTVTTPEQRQKTVAFFNTVHPLMTPETNRLIIVGTRWHDQDYYGYLVDQEMRRRQLETDGDEEAEDIDSLSIYIRRAVENGKSIFPSLLTERFLRRQRVRMGPYLYSCNYMQDPIAEGGSFDVKWIKDAKYDPHDLFPMDGTEPKIKITSKLTTVDLASSDSAKADYVVVMTSGVAHDDKGMPHLYVLEYNRGRVTAPKTVEWINDHWERHQPRKVGIEKVAYQATLKHWIEKGNEHRRLPIYVEDIPRTKVSGKKTERILRLVPFLAAGRIHFAKHHTELEDELLRFIPESSKHDDLLDCLADALELLQRPRRAVWQTWRDGHEPISGVTGR